MRILEINAYHGTASAFTSFQFRRSDKLPSKIGVWFTNDPNVACGFSKKSIRFKDDKPRVIHVHLKIKNPRVFNTYADFLEVYRLYDDASKMRKSLMRQGYDSIEITYSDTDGLDHRTDYAVFHDYQIENVHETRDFGEFVDLMKMELRKP